MEIECDTAKRDAIPSERGIDMSRTREVFIRPIWTLADNRGGCDEPPYLTYDYLDQRMVFSAWTYRSSHKRIITITNANERQQRRFEPRLR